MAVFRSLGSFIKRYKWALILLIVALSFFYWYEIRPITTYRSCAAQASVDARALLASKEQVAQGTSQGDAYRKLIDKNLYLRTDYESFLMKCLMYHGLQIMPLGDDTLIPDEAVDMNGQ